MIARTVRLLSIAFLTALACSQTGPTSVSRGGSETTNTYTVTVSGDSIYGSVSCACSLGIYAASYSPVFDTGYALLARSDTGGRYAFYGIPAGRYTVLIRDTNRTCGALHRSITVSGSPDDTLIDDTLRPTAAAQGVLLLARSIGDSVPVSNAHLYMTGSPFVVPLDDSGGFRFEGLPMARYDFDLYIENSFTTLVDYSDMTRKLHDLSIDAGMDVDVDTVCLREM